MPAGGAHRVEAGWRALHERLRSGRPAGRRRPAAGSEKTRRRRRTDGGQQSGPASRAAVQIQVRWMVTSLLGTLRVRMFMPDASETRMAGKPGWHDGGPEQLEQLEQVGSNFLAGLRVGLEGVPIDQITSRLEPISRTFRGFAYEGLAMGLAVADSTSLRPRRVRQFLAGPGADHVYMAYIGVGWGMARIPTMRWRAVVPRDPVLRWLALDGYGFHQAFFKTVRWASEHWRPQRYRAWPGPNADYAHNAVDQGIGRALWFINGADPHAVARAISGFEPSRHNDLWSGAGLASVYAGGVDTGTLTTFRELSGPYRPALAQGAAFAAKTRLMTGLVVPHTELAVKTHCEMPVQDAAAIVDEIGAALPPDGRLTSYEVWRQRIQERFR
jgi:enediyne biosynthesis protein E3